MENANVIKVSVVIPVYNGKTAFARCLDELIHQTLKEIEIICVDDGSTEEETKKILERYEKKDSRIRVIHQENQGAGVARNNGLAQAKGEYLSFLDADDFFEEDMLEKAYLACEAKKAEIGIFRGDRWDDVERKTIPMNYALRMEMLPQENPFTWHEIKDNVFTFVVGWAWDKLYLREFVEREGLCFQNTRTSNDLFFVFSSLTKAKSILAIDELLIHHRINQKSSLSVTREKSWNCFYLAGKALYDELVRSGVYPEAQKAYLSWMLHFSFWNLDTIVGPAYENVYELLRTEVFPFMEIDKYDREYFREPCLHDRAMEILQTDFKTYLIQELVKGRQKTEQLRKCQQEKKRMQKEIETLNKMLKEKSEQSVSTTEKIYRKIKKLVK